MKITKGQCQKIHFKKRFEERFCGILNRQDLRNIVTLIQTNQAKFIERQSQRISIFDVTYKDVEFRTVYDRTRKVVVTALFPDWE